MGVHDIFLGDFKLNANLEADFIDPFTGNMRIIPCPEVPVLEVEHTLMCKACLVCGHNIMQK
jgi:hypothetical protein